MSLITYTRDIPDGPNNPSVDQPKMKTNNNHIDDIIKVDHVGFNDALNASGYHAVIHQLPTTTPAIVAGVGQTYVKTIAGDQELFYESGLGVETQITGGGGRVVAAINFSVGPGPGFAITINSSINATVVRISQGLFVVGFTSPLSTQFYYPFVSAQGPLSVSAVTIATLTQGAAYVPTTAAFSFTVYNVSIPQVIDPVFASCIFFI